MAITASGLFFPTLEKMLIDTAGQSLEAETHNGALITDSATPNFDTHDFFNDLNANEVSGAGYTALGTNLTTTEITTSSGVLTYDHDDVSWASSTITSAMALVGMFDVGSAATNMLIYLSDFVTAVSTSNGTLLVTVAAGGIFTWDFTP